MKTISKYRSVLMGLGIIWIYCFHILPPAKWGTPIWYIHSQGYTGVDLFILLSGFGMIYAYTKHPVKDLKSYLRFEGKRFLRIYASFLPITAVIALVDNWTKIQILMRITYIEQLTVHMYKHLWFVGAILMYYIFVPFYLAPFCKAQNKKRFTIISMIIAYAVAIVARPYLRDDIVFPIFTRIPMFLLGIYWGYLAMNETDDTEYHFGHRKMNIAMIIFAIFIVITYFERLEAIPSPAFLGEGFTYWLLGAFTPVFFISSLCLIVAHLARCIDRFRAGHTLNYMLSYMGGITLEIYCMHEWAARKFSNLNSKIDAPRWYLATMIVVFFASVGVHAVATGIAGRVFNREK
ncbi:acyltransferase family protein [Butyrivibrio sp. FCS014]|uniref:acyltransferase family protein n=1 Tax=Butyrivibrio sp. FCS014 TaxID=1408304 RepID=UPI0004AE3A8C|nr:acyltransferase [Butyrivibrio sp. FCS014]